MIIIALTGVKESGKSEAGKEWFEKAKLRLPGTRH